jgi:16S rRNA (guanine966-N2)-methyltransferase
VRIIAGSRKGARIQAPKGRETRPTGDRVREAAFNLIGPVDGMRVLDLYAGSGAMGLEALSRGAENATQAIVRNVEKLALPGAIVLREDAARKLAADARSGREYDLVLIDPPYGILLSLLPMLAAHLPAVLAPDGLVVLESDARDEPELPLPKRTSRRYGSARVTVFTAR